MRATTGHPNAREKITYSITPDGMRPPLKWAGGKRWLLPRLKPLWTRHRDRRLVEPLCGGLAISFGLRPSRALLNDVNPHLINFYRWVQKGLVIERPMRNRREMFDRYKARFNELASNGGADSQEAAELFYYLNRTGFNGLFRTSRKTGFNVPFGQHEHIPWRRDFSEYRRAMKGWVLAAGDFEDLELERGDFVYADPPYDEGFTLYSEDGFSWEDQKRLVEWLSKHDGPVIISNHRTSRIEKLLESASFELTFVDAPRRISCDGDRTRAAEIVALKGIKWEDAVPASSRLEDV